MDYDAFCIVLSPNDSQLVSLSNNHIKLWDLETKECLAHLEFDNALYGKAQLLFSSDGASVSVEHAGRQKRWHIFPASHIHQTNPVILNNDGTMSLLICPAQPDNTEQGMVFVPIAEKQSNQDVPRKSYYCDKDGKWLLDQRSRRVLWIPPDDRPQEINMHGGVVIIQTESGKKYAVIPPLS